MLQKTLSYAISETKPHLLFAYLSAIYFLVSNVR